MRDRLPASRCGEAGRSADLRQFVPTLDRMDYIAAVSNCLGFCETIEKLLGVTRRRAPNTSASS